LFFVSCGTTVSWKSSRNISNSPLPHKAHLMVEVEEKKRTFAQIEEDMCSMLERFYCLEDSKGKRDHERRRMLETFKKEDKYRLHTWLRKNPLKVIAIL